MKTITTKFYSATLYLPPRMIARTEGGRSLTLSDGRHGWRWPVIEPHRAAAEKMQEQMGWRGRLIEGVLPDGKTHVFILCDALDMPRAT